MIAYAQSPVSALMRGRLPGNRPGKRSGQHLFFGHRTSQGRHRSGCRSGARDYGFPMARNIARSGACYVRKAPRVQRMVPGQRLCEVRRALCAVGTHTIMAGGHVPLRVTTRRPNPVPDSGPSCPRRAKRVAYSSPSGTLAKKATAHVRRRLAEAIARGRGQQAPDHTSETGGAVTQRNGKCKCNCIPGTCAPGKARLNFRPSYVSFGYTSPLAGRIPRPGGSVLEMSRRVAAARKRGDGGHQRRRPPARGVRRRAASRRPADR